MGINGINRAARNMLGGGGGISWPNPECGAAVLERSSEGQSKVSCLQVDSDIGANLAHKEE